MDQSAPEGDPPLDPEMTVETLLLDLMDRSSRLYQVLRAVRSGQYGKEFYIISADGRMLDPEVAIEDALAGLSRSLTSAGQIHVARSMKELGTGSGWR